MRLAEQAPAYCSGCFAQQVEQPHVDFESAWDGPVVERHGAGHDAVAIDDLILCADCLRKAVALLPESDDGGESEVERLRARVAELESRNGTLSGYADKLQDAIALKPDAEQAKEPEDKGAFGRRRKRAG